VGVIGVEEQESKQAPEIAASAGITAYKPPQCVVDLVSHAADKDVYATIRSDPLSKKWDDRTVQMMTDAVIADRRGTLFENTLRTIEARLTGYVRAVCLGRQGRIVLYRIEDWPDDEFN